jgi:hypothetical protein
MEQHHVPSVPPDQRSPYGPHATPPLKQDAPALPAGSRSPQGLPRGPPLERWAMDRRAVGRHYGGKHPRTMKRWQDRGILPPPDFEVNGRGYWWSDTIAELDRQRTIALAASRERQVRSEPMISEEQEPSTAP